jgi:prolyl-tRNA editing enzyme YbaK/EbsC (Cys-tRNA(Pro) deacylase)
VKRVRKALGAAGLEGRVFKLKRAAETPAATAEVLAVEAGAVIKTSLYFIGERPVLVLLAGDHACKQDGLPRVFNLEGEVRKAFAVEIKSATGYNVGCVPPVALAKGLPIVMDAGLKRFDKLYAPAGHAECLFGVTAEEIKGLTGCLVSYNIALPVE